MDQQTTRSLELNSNSYLSIGIVLLLIAATLWIKDGQSQNATANQRVADDLSHYKELNMKDAEILKMKIDGLTTVVRDATSDRWTPRDVNRIWREFGSLNPTVKLPTLPNDK